MKSQNQVMVQKCYIIDWKTYTSSSMSKRSIGRHESPRFDYIDQIQQLHLMKGPQIA